MLRPTFRGGINEVDLEDDYVVKYGISTADRFEFELRSSSYDFVEDIVIHWYETGRNIQTLNLDGEFTTITRNIRSEGVLEIKKQRSLTPPEDNHYP